MWIGIFFQQVYFIDYMLIDLTVSLLLVSTHINYSSDSAVCFVANSLCYVTQMGYVRVKAFHKNLLCEDKMFY